MEERMKQLEEEMQRYRDVLRRYQEEERREGGAARQDGPSQSAEPGIGSLPEVGRERRSTIQAPLSFGSTGSGRLVYAKPFVTYPKAIVGGYMDMQFRTHRRFNPRFS